MFTRRTGWFICIYVAITIATVCSDTNTIADTNTTGAAQEDEGVAALDVEPAAKTSVAVHAANGTSPTSQLHSDTSGLSPTPESTSATTVDCRAPPRNATAVSILESLSEKEKNKRLIKAANNGSVQDVWEFLAAGADVRATDVLLMTALHWAARKGHGEVVSCLLWAGAPVTATDGYRNTALHHAAGSGHTAVVAQLVAASADVSARDFLGWTPLHDAARKGHTEVVRALLAAGADKAAKTDSANSPLDIARLNNQHHLADLLT